VAGGVFGDDLLIVGGEGAEVVTADDVVFATGAHDGIALFEGNDLPGVMSARAAGMLLAEGVMVGRRVAVVAGEPSGFGAAFALAADGLCEVIRIPAVVRARGSSAVRAVITKEGQEEREIRIDALLLDEPRAPAYELCLQAGAELEHLPRGFVVKTDEGWIRDGFWAVGEVRGTPFEPLAMRSDAALVARRILENHASSRAPNIASPPAMATKSKVPSKTK
jgi:sarcosine oxidase, subunit alpha